MFTMCITAVAFMMLAGDRAAALRMLAFCMVEPTDHEEYGISDDGRSLITALTGKSASVRSPRGDTWDMMVRIVAGR